MQYGHDDAHWIRIGKFGYCWVRIQCGQAYNLQNTSLKQKLHTKSLWQLPTEGRWKPVDHSTPCSGQVPELYQYTQHLSVHDLQWLPWLQCTSNANYAWACTCCTITELKLKLKLAKITTGLIKYTMYHWRHHWKEWWTDYYVGWIMKWHFSSIDICTHWWVQFNIKKYSGIHKSLN